MLMLGDTGLEMHGMVSNIKYQDFSCQRQNLLLPSPSAHPIGRAEPTEKNKLGLRETWRLVFHSWLVVIVPGTKYLGNEKSSRSRRGELSCPVLGGECQFHAKSYEPIDAFLACSPDWARGPPPSQCFRRYAPNAVCRCLAAGQLYPSCGFSSADCRCFQPLSIASVHNSSLIHIDFWSE